MDHDISDEHALLVHTDCEGLLIQDEREKSCIFQDGCIFSAQATKTMMKLVTYFEYLCSRFLSFQDKKQEFQRLLLCRILPYFYTYPANY